MRIIIDSRMWKWTGIGTYIRVLLEGLAEIRPDHEIRCLIRQEDREEITRAGIEGDGIRFLECPAKVYSLREMRGLARFLRGIDFDLVHFPHYIYPFRENGLRAVVTIHDLIHLRFPKYHKTPLHYAFARFVMSRSARAAQSVITVSNYSKQDIVERLGVAPEKIRVIYNGLRKGFTAEADPSKRSAAERTRERLNLVDPYVLYVGNAKEHKNLEGLFQAFGRMLKRWDRKQAGIDRPTLAVTVTREELRGSAAAEIPESIRFLGRIEGGILADLYRAAAVLALPSYCEGFGLPPLEAMACGAPVVCSNAASLPEVVGDAALQVPPDDLDRLSSALYDLLTMEDVRIRLRNEGLKRAQLFTARAMSEATLKVYEEAAPAGSASAGA